VALANSSGEGANQFYFVVNSNWPNFHFMLLPFCSDIRTQPDLSSPLDILTPGDHITQITDDIASSVFGEPQELIGIRSIGRELSCERHKLRLISDAIVYGSFRELS
jgi:hypothetical protein